MMLTISKAAPFILCGIGKVVGELTGYGYQTNSFSNHTNPSKRILRILVEY